MMGREGGREGGRAYLRLLRVSPIALGLGGGVHPDLSHVSGGEGPKEGGVDDEEAHVCRRGKRGKRGREGGREGGRGYCFTWFLEGDLPSLPSLPPSLPCRGTPHPTNSRLPGA